MLDNSFEDNSNADVTEGYQPSAIMRGRKLLHPKRKRSLFPINQTGGAPLSRGVTENYISPVEQGLQQAKKLSETGESLDPSISNKGIKRKRSASRASNAKKPRRGKSSSSRKTKKKKKLPTKRKSTSTTKKKTHKKKTVKKSKKKKKKPTKKIKKKPKKKSKPNQKKKKKSTSKKPKKGKRSKKDIFGFI